MNRHPTKAEIKQEHDRQIQEFLAKGGKIKNFEMGASALVDGKYNTRNIVIEKKPYQTRTPVPEALAAIDSRRRASPARKSPVKRRPEVRKQKVIYDDFGEPLRTVWVDE